MCPWVLLPILIVVIGNAGIWIGCMVAIENGSVTSERFPFVSECADQFPQGPFITMVYNICAVLVWCFVVIRFLLTRNFANNEMVNIASIIFGFCATAGFVLLGSFQVSQYVKTHYAASVLLFYGLVAFFWAQLYLVYKTELFPGRRYIGPIMGFTSVINSMLTVCIYILSNDNAAICEMVMFTTALLKFGLFIPEFRNIDGLGITLKSPHSYLR